MDDDSETVMGAEDAADMRTDKDDDDEDVWDEESEYLEQLAQEGARLQAKAAAREGASSATDADSDSDSEEEGEDDFFYETSVDKIDPFLRFKTALGILERQNGQAYSAATTGLTQEQQVAFMEVVSKGLAGQYS